MNFIIKVINNFILKYKSYKIKHMVFNLEELLQLFPKHERIDINKIKELLDSLYDNCTHYQDIYNYFLEYIKTCFPGSNREKYSYESPEYNEYFDYIYDVEKDHMTFNSWIKYVESNFLSKFGQRRTYDEACLLAADKWCEMMFKFHLQDNGAINEDHGGGFWACALATVMKNDSMKEITEEMVKATHDNLYKYYKNRCWYECKDKDDSWSGYVNLYVDYHPNRPLYDILKDSGIPEKHIDSLCPWKTGIDIDETDNAVVVKGYQKCNYL